MGGADVLQGQCGVEKERTSDRVLKTPTSRDGAERGDSGKRRLSREAMAVNARKSGGAEGEEEGSSES